MISKLLAIILVLCFAVSLVPAEAFCEEHCQKVEATHHDCCVTCHASFNVEMPAESSFVRPSFISVFHVTQEASYLNPIIARFKRPPIQIS